MTAFTCTAGHAGIATTKPATCPGFVHGEPCSAQLRARGKEFAATLRAGVAAR
jgi:hypothetical protein